jgi:hypothetical protein
MNRSNWFVIVITVVVLVHWTLGFFGGGSDTIEYRGMHFKMRKFYADYEDYKEDPNNLDTNELTHIEAVMLGAQISTNYDTRKQFIRAMFDMKFPGYGLEQFGEKQQADGSILSMFSVDIPQRDKDRYFVARNFGHGFTIVDDFVASSASNAIFRAALTGNKLDYFDEGGQVVREHDIAH